MKNIYRNIGFTVTPLYLLVSIVVLFILWKSPERIAENLSIIDQRELSKIKQVMLLHVYIPVGLMFLVSALALVAFILAYQKQVNFYQIARQSYTTNKETQDSTKENVTDDNSLNYNLTAVKQLWEQENYANESHKWEKLLTLICNQLEASQAAYYTMEKEEDKPFLTFKAGYAYYLPESKPIRFELGEGLMGQAAKEGKFVNIPEIPEGYITILSGLGKSSSAHLGIIPIRTEGKVSGMIEMASFKKITKADENYLQSVASLVGG
jgi:putative methionine-R-sulfoxide reductase with GAF domain